MPGAPKVRIRTVQRFALRQYAKLAYLLQISGNSGIQTRVAHQATAHIIICHGISGRRLFYFFGDLSMIAKNYYPIAKTSPPHFHLSHFSFF